MEHINYPHEPGTVWGCEACMDWDCGHRNGESDEWCVSDLHGDEEL